MFSRLGQGQATDFVQGECARLCSDAHIARFFAKSCTVASRTDLVADHLGEFLAHSYGVCFLVAAFKIADDALEAMLARRDISPLVDVDEWNDFAARSVEQDLLDALVQPGERRLDIKAVMCGQRSKQLEVELVAPIPAANRAGSK